MLKAIEVTLEVNLEQFSRLLWQRKISHRIHALEDRQVIAVPTAEDVGLAIELYKQWSNNNLKPVEEDSANVGSYFSSIVMINNGLSALSKAPVSLITIVVCIILALVAPMDSVDGIRRALLFPDFSYGTRTLNLELIFERFSVNDFFKMLSPILLHGSWLHLVFNMLWLWEFGKRIERLQASWKMVFLMVVLALVSNSTQYIISGSIYFVGMSGVVYGLFAYICMWQLFDPRKGLNLPGSLIFFMLISLAIMSFIGFERIADEAHIAGLLCGGLYGAIVSTISRIRR